jgi:hypothetical protein
MVEWISVHSELVFAFLGVLVGAAIVLIISVSKHKWPH